MFITAKSALSPRLSVSPATILLKAMVSVWAHLQVVCRGGGAPAAVGEAVAGEAAVCSVAVGEVADSGCNIPTRYCSARWYCNG